MRRMDDRGFSLVELILIIAIMAILMGVLSPQFIKYVESSRVQKDESMLGEVENAARAAYAIEEVYDSLPPGDSTTVVTISDGAQVSADLPRLEEELRKTVPDTIHFVSKKYKAAGDQTVSISIDVIRQTVVVTNSWN